MNVLSSRNTRARIRSSVALSRRPARVLRILGSRTQTSRPALARPSGRPTSAAPALPTSGGAAELGLAVGRQLALTVGNTRRSPRHGRRVADEQQLHGEGSSTGLVARR